MDKAERTRVGPAVASVRSAAGVGRKLQERGPVYHIKCERVVTVRTQSGAIELTQLAGRAGVTSGSGSVTLHGVAGALSVTTNSSALVGRAPKGQRAGAHDKRDR